MRLHCIQHVAYEGPGVIARWAEAKGHTFSYTRRFQNDPVPSPEEIDWLIVMGGPMGVHDTGIFPWLTEEKKYIETVLTSQKIVIGICLGAQLIADVLGARVYASGSKEIGWHDVHLTDLAAASRLWTGVPRDLQVFQWHGDTFDLPSGAIRAAIGKACENQAFVCKNAVALQFHLETTLRDALKLVEECPEDLAPGPFVQSQAEFLTHGSRFVKANAVLHRLLDNFSHADQGGSGIGRQ